MRDCCDCRDRYDVDQYPGCVLIVEDEVLGLDHAGHRRLFDLSRAGYLVVHSVV